MFAAALSPRRHAAPVLALLALLLAPMPALAAEPVNGGNTAWLLSASALVLFMSLPGLALFYGGLVASRNLLSVLMQCFAVCCIASIVWSLVGYSLVFAPGGPLIGGLSRALLDGIGGTLAPTGIPESAFVLFQLTFAVITPALIIGAFVERASFPFVILFTALWLLVVYAPVGHWVWGHGWLAQIGTVDFAGGIVVHTTAGVSALVAALVIGRRRGFPHLAPPHSPGLTMAGAGMLWVGWFGFNGGSALAASGSAALAALATQLAASAAGLSWMSIEWARMKPTSVGLVTGCVAGLASITPASGFVGPMGAIAIGVIGGGCCFFVTSLIKIRFAIDDSLDVFAVHGVGGMVGSILVALFASPALGGAGYAAGMTFASQLGAQALGVAAAALWSAAATWGLVKLIGLLVPLRVPSEAELEGLDVATHGERAYEHG